MTKSTPALVSNQLGHEERYAKMNEKFTAFIGSLTPKPCSSLIEWRRLEEIIAVLDRLARERPDGHYTFLPENGGIELIGADRGPEPRCIQLEMDNYVYIARPSSLACFPFPKSPAWSYFDLDLEQLEPRDEANAGETKEYVLGRVRSLRRLKPFEGPFGLPGPVDRAVETIHPRRSLEICRILRGRLVIFSKGSPYNLNPSTDDGRHDRMTRGDFHCYIERAIERSGPRSLCCP